MNAVMLLSCVLGACFTGGLSCSVIARTLVEKQQKQKQRERIRSFSGATVHHTSDYEQNAVLRYAERLTGELFSGAIHPLFAQPGKTRCAFLAKWYIDHAAWAGCNHAISAAGFVEASIRLTGIGALAGLLFGLLFSTAFGISLGVLGALGGFLLPILGVKKEIQKRAQEADLHLSEMLQIVSLGLRSGLTFDRSFALYGRYFNNSFSRSCTRAYRQWTLGLCSREQALREFAESYNCNQLTRVIESVLRSLKFGTALAPTLDEASSQARAVYRAQLEERVAKAPVKMMLPTGTLILPAMLLLVLGPVLLELAQGF